MSRVAERAAGDSCVRPDAQQVGMARAGDADVMDLRFRALVGEDAWSRLPEAVRRRFSKRLSDGEAVVYQGCVVSTELTAWGRLLALAATAIGGPLPRAGTTGAAVVVVTEDKRLGGQSWTRTYARPGRFPQVVHSAKRFCGPTGLEEYVGCGVGMALTVYAREDALIFRSEHYFVQLLGRRFVLPAWLTPGTLYVTHANLPDGKFSFTLQIFHPRLGLLMRQMAVFREAAS